jgi:hypothetical protein
MSAWVKSGGDDQGESEAHVGIAPKADVNSSLSRSVPELVSKIPLGTGRRTLLASFCVKPNQCTFDRPQPFGPGLANTIASQSKTIALVRTYPRGSVEGQGRAMGLGKSG